MKKIIILFFLFSSTTVFSQTISIGIKYFGLSIHPKGSINSELMPLKFDEKGLLVLNTGFYISIEYYIPNYEFISIKFIQGIYNDCIKQFAGFTHIGFRLNTPELNGFMFSGGIGPTLIFRKNWYDILGYNDSFSFFNGTPQDYWQWRFLWYGGELEFNQKITADWALSATFIPGFPDLLNISIGAKYTK
jgi:hypothetical protein